MHKHTNTKYHIQFKMIYIYIFILGNQTPLVLAHHNGNDNIIEFVVNHNICKKDDLKSR